MRSYPNPNNGEVVTLELDNMPGEGEYVTVELTDVFGRVFPVETFSNDEKNSTRMLTFNQSLTNGMYVLNVKYNGVISTHKVIVSK